MAAKTPDPPNNTKASATAAQNRLPSGAAVTGGVSRSGAEEAIQVSSSRTSRGPDSLARAGSGPRDQSSSPAGAGPIFFPPSIAGNSISLSLASPGAVLKSSSSEAPGSYSRERPRRRRYRTIRSESSSRQGSESAGETSSDG